MTDRIEVTRDDASGRVELARRVESHGGMSNELDVLVEIALFEPDAEWIAIRANSAGTKTIVTSPAGDERTFWARDWTISAHQRRETARLLRAPSRTRTLSHEG